MVSKFGKIVLSLISIFRLFSSSVPLWLPLNPGEVDMVDMADMVDTEVTVDTEVMVDTATVDTVARDPLMLKPGEVDTVDMDMEVMVDTVDMEVMVDTAVDTVDTVARETPKLNQKPKPPL